MDLFDTPDRQEILKDVVLLRRFVAPLESDILSALAAIVKLAPLRQMLQAMASLDEVHRVSFDFCTLGMTTTTSPATTTSYSKFRVDLL